MFLEGLRSTKLFPTLAAYIVPIVFVFFFVHHVYFVYAYDMTVWKGGIFGMFSGPDHTSARHLYLYVTDSNGKEYELAPILALDKYSLVDFSVLPHPDILEYIHKAVFDQPMYVAGMSGGGIVLNNKPSNFEQEPFIPTQLRVELWKMNHLDGIQNTLHKSKTTEWILK